MKRRGIRRLLRSAVRLTGYDVVPLAARPERRDQFAAYARLGLAPGVIYDVGANVGATVDRYLREYPQARLVAVEPLPHLAQHLTRRFAAHDNVRVVHAALADDCGTRLLLNTVADGNSSFFEVSAQQRGCSGHDEQTRVKQRLEVPTTTLDRLAEDCGSASIDVLKLDIQGAELLALRGAAGLLGRRGIRAIYCEVNFAPIYDGQCQYHDLAELLMDRGYWLYDLFGANHQTDGSITHCNALFFSPDVPRGRWQ